MIAVCIWLAIFVSALLVRLLHARSVERVRADQRERLISYLRAKGMTLRGDVAQLFELHGTVHGEEISLSNDTQLRWPGAFEEPVRCYRVQFSARIDDCLVCPKMAVDRFMGPVPAVRPTPTGNAQFDQAYSIFVTPGAELRESDFRTSPFAAAMSWTKTEVLEQFLAARPAYFRAQEGRCELVGEPIGAGEVAAKMVLCVNLARAAQGKALMESPPVYSSEAAIRPLFSTWSMMILALLWGFTLTVIVQDIGVLQEYSAEYLQRNGLHPGLRIPMMVFVISALSLGFGVLVSAVLWWKQSHAREAERAT